MRRTVLSVPREGQAPIWTVEIIMPPKVAHSAAKTLAQHRTWLLCLVVACGVSFGCEGDQFEPDRIVNIEKRCWVYSESGNKPWPCDDTFTFGEPHADPFPFGSEQILTIRTGEGSVYEVAVEASMRVEVQDVWPQP